MNIFSHLRALAPIAAAAMVLGIASPALAKTESFSFGDLLPGQIGPDNNSIWGTLSVTTGPSNTYTFWLGLNSNFSTLFGSGAFVSEAIFNTPSGVDPTSAAIDSGTWGVTKVQMKNNVPPLSLGFDFGDKLCSTTGDCSQGSPSGRLQAGESVKWDTTFKYSQGDPLTFAVPPVGLHVQAFSTYKDSNGRCIKGSDGKCITSAWYGVTTPVPEPETYAMMLAGLGLIGFTARRRRGG